MSEIFGACCPRWPFLGPPPGPPRDPPPDPPSATCPQHDPNFRHVLEHVFRVWGSVWQHVRVWGGPGRHPDITFHPKTHFQHPLSEKDLLRPPSTSVLPLPTSNFHFHMTTGGVGFFRILFRTIPKSKKSKKIRKNPSPLPLAQHRPLFHVFS